MLTSHFQKGQGHCDSCVGCPALWLQGSFPPVTISGLGDSMLPPRCRGDPGTLLWQYFLQAGCPSCRPTNNVKGLKTQHEMKCNIYSHIFKQLT